MRVLIMSFSLFLVSACSVVTPKASRLSSDQELSKLMVGSWTVSPRDASYFEDGAISTYREDGYVDFVRYEDYTCNKIIMSSAGTWQVKNGQLLITAIRSSDPDVHPKGMAFVDDILKLNAQEQELRSDKGVMQYRLRSKTCVVQSKS